MKINYCHDSSVLLSVAGTTEVRCMSKVKGTVMCLFY